MPRQVLARHRGAAVSVTAAALSATLLFVVPAAFAAPANDNFANAKPLRLGKNVTGNINGATKQSGEPRHAKSLATHSVWYRLRVKRKMTVAVNTCNTSSDTVIAVYAGRSLHGLKVVQYNNDGCNRTAGGSRVTFQARRGVTYRVAVAGFADKGTFRIGAFKLSVLANDYFADAVEVTVGESVSGNTVNATRESGSLRTSSTDRIPSGSSCSRPRRRSSRLWRAHPGRDHIYGQLPQVIEARNPDDERPVRGAIPSAGWGHLPHRAGVRRRRNRIQLFHESGDADSVGLSRASETGDWRTSRRRSRGRA